MSLATPLSAVLSAILCTGRRTVANLLRTVAPLTDGHRTTSQRVLSSAEWSALRLACQLCRVVLALVPDDQPVILLGDDTVDGHPGRLVYGKARHRGPVRSSHGYTAWRYGHKWVVLAVLIRFPWATRPWALPVLVDLYRSEEDDRKRGRPVLVRIVHGGGPAVPKFTRVEASGVAWPGKTTVTFSDALSSVRRWL
jgi:hypothetical protein